MKNIWQRLMKWLLDSYDKISGKNERDMISLSFPFPGESHIINFLGYKQKEVLSVPYILS